MDRDKREEINKKFAEKRAILTARMSELKNAPNLIVDRQAFLARNEEGTMSLREMTEEAKETNVEQLVHSQHIMELHKRNAEFKRARESEVRTIRGRAHVAERSLGNMAQKVRDAAGEIEKATEMMLPAKEKIIVKNSLEKELASLRGYEIPSYNNQRGWTENRDNNGSSSVGDSGVYGDGVLGHLGNPRLKNVNARIKNRSINAGRRSESVPPRADIVVNKDVVRFPQHYVAHRTIGMSEQQNVSIPVLPRHQLS